MKTKEWSETSKTVKKKYLYNLQGLYGCNVPVEEMPFKGHAESKVKRKRRNQYERTTQIKLVSWMRSMGFLFTAIPNGAKRSAITGHIERSMGLTAGVSDLFLAMPSKHYHGFWIEMKAPGKKPTDLQYEWMDKARKQGYKAEYYDCYEEARKAVEDYLAN